MPNCSQQVSIRPTFFTKLSSLPRFLYQVKAGDAHESIVIYKLVPQTMAETLNIVINRLFPTSVFGLVAVYTSGKFYISVLFGYVSIINTIVLNKELQYLIPLSVHLSKKRRSTRRGFEPHSVLHAYKHLIKPTFSVVKKV